MSLLRKLLNQTQKLVFIIFIFKALLFHKFVIVNHLHVGSLAKRLSKSGFARGFGSNDARNLGKHCFPSILINFKHIAVSIDATNLAELFIEGDNGHILLCESFETFVHSFHIVVSTALAS